MWPGFAEAANTPKWLLLSVLVPFLAPKLPPWALLWLALAGTSLIWATSPYDGILALWCFGLLIGLILAAKKANFDDCMAAYCYGICINSVFAILQFYGIDLVPKATGNAGLLVNPNFLAAAALLGIVWASAHRNWLLTFLMCPALFLPMAKGPVLVGAVMLAVWLVKKSPPWGLPALAGLAGCAFYYFHQYGLNDTSLARWELWQNSVAMFQWYGHGIGSFWSAYPEYWNTVTETSAYGYGMLNHPKTAHNDLITLSVELGVVGILTWFGLVALCFVKGSSKYVLIAFLGIGLFSHPLFIPSSAGIAAIAAGDCLRRWDILRATNRVRRNAIRDGNEKSRPGIVRALFSGGWSDAFEQTFPRWRGVRVHGSEHGPAHCGIRN